MNDQRGFTLAELLISLGIISILGTIGISNYVSFRNESKVETAVSEIVGNLREVSERSKSQQDDSKWGIHFVNPTGSGNDYYEIFKGEDYATGTVVTTNYLDKSVSFTDPYENSTKDVIFSKITGSPESKTSVVVDFQTFTGVVIVGDLGRVISSVEEGLIGYWNFDETTGSAGYDRSGNGSNLSLSGDSYRSSGKVNYALDMSGNDSGSWTDSNDLYDITDDLTISFWVRPDAEYVGDSIQLVNMWSSTSDANFVVYYFGTTGSSRDLGFYANRGGAWGTISASQNLTLGEWYHVALSYSNGGQLYINGSAVGSVVGSGDLATNDAALNIGASGFDGMLDDVRIYNRALGATDIQRIYNSTK